MARIQPIIEHVKVSNQVEARRAIAPYDASGSARDLLLRGFTELTNKFSAWEQTMVELAESAQVMGGYEPAKPVDPLTGRHWVDDIIVKRMGGKRDRLMVKWTLNGDTFTWNPFTREFKQCK